MSQIGVVLSCSSITGTGTVSGTGVQAWSIEYSYQLDAGGTGSSIVYVGNGLGAQPIGSVPGPGGGPLPAIPVAAFWVSPTSLITVSPNPQGTTNPVQLSCPDVVKAALFGIRVAGVPTQ